MQTMRFRILTSVAVLAVLGTAAHAGKPLKVFILAGQSNMEGKARVRTIERLNMTEDSKQMYKDMGMKNGLPSPVKDVYGVYISGTKIKGPLQPGFGTKMTKNTTFGPVYPFSIYMKKHLNEPFLVIKTAWGGMSLLQQFRPPSGGEYKSKKDKHGNPTGHFYHLIVKGVKEVLADPGQYHPAYNKADGYEIAGFAWFQGWNDAVGRYPRKGKRGKTKDYSEYSRLMACFIRDIRKDLDAPKMPFVIGVLGVGGVNEKDPFRLAQEAPAKYPEFKGNVAAFRTGPYWDMELVRLENKVIEACKKELLTKDPTRTRGLGRRASRMVRSRAPKVLTPEELKLWKVGQSNAGFHYMGSAYIYGGIGKAFADTMAKMVK